MVNNVYDAVFMAEPLLDVGYSVYLMNVEQWNSANWSPTRDHQYGNGDTEIRRNPREYRGDGS